VSKRTAEQALRDELGQAQLSLERARKDRSAADKAARDAKGRVEAAALKVDAAENRVERAENALAALLPPATPAG
jgi:predicted  nucleic acid-binding Zn-ribbon protein